MTRILIREGADLEVSGLFFKAFVQAVLLFWGRGVGSDPPYGAGPEKLPEQGRVTVHP